MNSERDMATDKNWSWLRAKGMILDYLVVEPRGDNTFEAIIKDGYPPKVNRVQSYGFSLFKHVYRLRPTDLTDRTRPRTSSYGIQNTITGANNSIIDVKEKAESDCGI